MKEERKKEQLGVFSCAVSARPEELDGVLLNGFLFVLDFKRRWEIKCLKKIVFP